MHNGLFGGGMGVGLAEAEEAVVSMNSNPEPLNRSSMNRNALGKTKGLNFRDLHEN